MSQITYQIQPYSYIQTFGSSGATQTHLLPTGSIQAEIRLYDNSSSNINHVWYGEIKFNTGNSYFLLSATTPEISDEDISNVIYIYISSDTIVLKNKFSTTKYLHITIIQ